MEARLYPPLQGVSEALAFGDHDAGYARDGQNVRSIDAANGRARLTKRPGLSKRSTSALNGAAKVKELAQVVFNNLVADFANLGAGNAVMDRSVNDTPYIGGGYRIVSSPRGDVYGTTTQAANGGRTVHRYNADLSLISSFTIAKYGSNCYIEALYVDEFDNVWIGVQGTATGGRRILRYELAPDNEHRFVWALRDAGAAPNDMWKIAALKTRGDSLYVFEENPTTEELRVRSFKNIYDAVAPKEVELEFQVFAAAANNEATGMDVSDLGNIYVSFHTGGGADQYVRKYSPGGTLIWTLQSTVLGRGGHGLGVAVKGSIVATVGWAQGANTQWLNRYTDNGTTATHVWAVTSASTALTTPIPVQIDAFDTIHALFPFAIHSDGISEYQAYAGSVSPATLVASTPATTAAGGYTTPVTGLALPPTSPEYAQAVTPPVVPEYVYLATTSTDYARWRLVSASPTTGSTRSTEVLAACGDDLVLVPAGAPSVPTGGSGALNTNARYVQMATGYSKVYIVDGISNLVYDPIEAEVTEWYSNTSGTIPKRCSLIEFWNGRACLSGDPDNRHLLHMSAAGDPLNWDLFPPTPTSTMALSITTMPAIGGVSDIINTMIPYSNDLLVLGGDKTISVVRGDPAAGGAVDQITTGLGMAFGRPWCIGPQGEVYFYASVGGLYALNPYSGDIMPLSRDKLDRQLRDVDLESYYVRMVYDHKMHGVMVLVFPYEAGGTLVRSWFVDVRNGAFWPERYGTSADTDVQPTAVCVFDADDPDDRTILVGCEDGFVRYVNQAATSDEGASAVGIDAYVTLGPFVSEDAVHEVRMRDLYAAMGDKGDVAWEVFASHKADIELLEPVASGVFQQGRSARHSVRARGQALWVRLRNSDTTGSFALESLTARLSAGDKVRMGAF